MFLYDNAVQKTAIAQKKVALVTGAAQGIGRAVARRMVGEGYAVVLSDIDARHGERTVERLGKELGLHAAPEAIFVRADVSDEEDVQRLVENVREKFGRLDLLVNNAGIAAPENDAIETLDLARWNRILATDLTGAFLCVKHCVALLRESDGNVVNISSTRAHMSEPNTEAYTAAKGGLTAFTRALAMSLGPEIRVNSISPGWIDVSSEHFEKAEVADVARESHDFHPVGRVGTPADVAALVAFLASDDASFVTGADYVMDGGMSRKMVYL